MPGIAVAARRDPLKSSRYEISNALLFRTAQPPTKPDPHPPAVPVTHYFCGSIERHVVQQELRNGRLVR
jgi:hypothetical protein